MAPTVVLLHGFTHTGASWDRVITALPQSYRALAPDIRGHGRASAVTPVSLEAVLSDVLALAPPVFTLVGYSMGGRIALHLALAAPERIDHLVLIGASPGLCDPEERAARQADDELLAADFERLDIEVLADRWANTPVLADQPAHVRQAVHADRLRSTPAGLARALRRLGTGALPSLWHRLDELRMPVTLVVGERDAKFLGVARRMSTALPGARLDVVPEAGHAVHLEAPDAVAELILARGAVRHL
jgi:2-succinyl-6-hydroxy-2,4-cyclohexadiene-1-carboxylate synthase